MDSYKYFTIEERKSILIITINREKKLNALNLELLDELNDIIREIYQSKEIRCAMITGRGQKAFAAGADIAELAEMQKQEGKKMSLNGQSIFQKIEHCPKPILAAVNGFALGGGCELAMACHFRIASENAKLGLPEINLGIMPGYGGTQRMIQLIGKGFATELLLSGEMISSSKALALGLVNHVVPQDELYTFCMQKLEHLATKAPIAVARILRTVNTFFDPGLNAYEVEAEQFSECLTTNDFKEGVSAFLEKGNHHLAEIDLINQN